MLSKNRISSYLLYAIGEVVLVVIGILIAVEINNQNEIRKQRHVEIDVLNGIRSDLLKDTTDLSLNMRIYLKEIRKDSLALKHLSDAKEKTTELIVYLHRICYNDLFIFLHTSHFEETKLKGLSVISKEALRDRINHIYEFRFTALSFYENESEKYNYSHFVRKALQPYFSFEGGDITIVEDEYRKLQNDHNALYQLEYARQLKKKLLIHHLGAVEELKLLADAIQTEVDRLKQRL